MIYLRSIFGLSFGIKGLYLPGWVSLGNEVEVVEARRDREAEHGRDQAIGSY